MTDKLPFEYEEVELTDFERRELERIKKIVNVISDEIIVVDGVKTVLAEIEGEKVNVAIPSGGLVETIPPELFEPLAIGGKIIYVKKSPALDRIKEKMRKGKAKEREKPKKLVPGIEEYGALEKFLEGEEIKHEEKKPKEWWEYTREEFANAICGSPLSEYEIGKLKKLGLTDEDFKVVRTKQGEELVFAKIGPLDRLYRRLLDIRKHYYSRGIPEDVKQVLVKPDKDNLNSLIDWVGTFLPTYIGMGEKGLEAHKAAVRDAIKEGKPVPPRVLEDYPELKKLAQYKELSDAVKTLKQLRW